VTDPTPPARRSPLEHERDDMPTDLTPTVIRAPTLAEAQSRAQEAIRAAELRGVVFSRISTGAIAGDTVITIYWNPADAD